MGFKDNKVTVIAVMDNTPGAQAGLQAGDEIISVDGTATEKIQPEEVAMRIRGEVGTSVVLGIRREAEELTYEIVRGTIETKTVAGRMLENKVGYIVITSFTEHTGEEFGKKYEELVAQGMEGLILDLRGNPGGLLKACVEVGQYILPQGLIVSVVERDGSRQEYMAEKDKKLPPLVVLIDKNSASASEILAGAVQDRGAGTLIGETSYGKGSVQTIMPMNHEDALKITIAKYYTPSGRSIDGTGVEPDIKIDLPAMQGEGERQDLQFQKAEEILREKLAK